MDETILVELAHMVRAHPWWRARARLTLALLHRRGVRSRARVLDAGCGWGTTLEALERRGYRAAGMDISRRALERLDRPGRELYVADLTRDVMGHGNGFDAVLALDVIEHIDDDRAAVTRLGRLVRPRGRGDRERAGPPRVFRRVRRRSRGTADATCPRPSAQPSLQTTSPWNKSSGGANGSSRCSAGNGASPAGSRVSHRNRSPAATLHCLPGPHRWPCRSVSPSNREKPSRASFKPVRHSLPSLAALKNGVAEAVELRITKRRRLLEAVERRRDRSDFSLGLFSPVRSDCSWICVSVKSP